MDNKKEQKRVFAAVKAVIPDENGAFLVICQRVDGRDIWDFPGGKIEWGDSHESTLKREVKEETGLDIEIERPLGTAHFFRFSDKHQVAVTLFLVKRVGDREVDVSRNPVNENSDEMKVDDYRWMSREEFLSDEVDVPHETYKDLIQSSATIF